ncbi:SHOCT domain-containing protein [Thermanaerosceptrum fracticalcis]|uniref:SHOCT domain-containing protein n=1 Tax=Thermanaerosceptrum fracticalcis TaxID=1712410 RepID=UPI001FAB43CC|nr:SHOCT domain-containing protein [Thermanaerosceptrum fracticalcis]
MLLQLIFWIGLIYVGVKLFRRFSYRGHSCGWDRRDSLDILRERYARGEISTEEYLHRKEDLMRY